MALDVHWSLQQIFDYLNVTHQINSFNDNGFPINAHIRFSTENQYKDNAFWSPILKILVFGEGATKFRPVASLDAVAHEFGHGITDFQVGWDYSSSNGGAFHEGMSDIWGAILENRIRPNSIWQIGEQITLGHSCLRNIQYTNDPNARVKISDTYESSQYNSGSIYVKGGVFSHWFYLLVNGGTGTNAIGNTFTVHGVGMDLAENLLVEAVFNNYLKNTTTYPEIRTAMVNAAKGLSLGQYSILAQQVENAWYAVGVGLQPTQLSLSGPDELCSGILANYSISNLPQGATVTWYANGLNLSTATGTSTNATTKQGAGAGYVRATITSSNSTLTLKKEVALNGYTPIIGPDFEYLSNRKAYFEIDTQEPSVWSVNGNKITSTLYPNRIVIPLYQYYPGSVLVTCAVNSSCGRYEARKDFQIIGDEEALDVYSIYPNPASTTFSIKQNEQLQTMSGMLVGETKSQDNFSILIYNDQSQLVRQQKVYLNQAVSIDNLREGFYIIHIKDGKKVHKKKLIISKN